MSKKLRPVVLLGVPLFLLVAFAGFLKLLDRAADPDPVRPPFPKESPAPKKGSPRSKPSDGLPADPAKPVDLLPLIDPSRDAICGKWIVKGGSLVCIRARDYVRLQIPHSVPPEYDVELVAERRDSTECLILGLVTPGRQVVVSLDGKGYDPQGKLVHPVCSMIRDVGSASEADTLRVGRFLKESGPSTIRCSVRKDKLKVVVDDVVVFDWAAAYDHVSVPKRWGVPNRKVLFLGSYDCSYSFSRLILSPAR